MGTSVIPVLVNGGADIHGEVLVEYWRGKKGRDGGCGEVTGNCELKCYLLNKT